MGKRVAVSLAPVAAAADNPAVSIEHESTHWHFARVRCLSRQIERLAHRALHTCRIHDS